MLHAYNTRLPWLRAQFPGSFFMKIALYLCFRWWKKSGSCLNLCPTEFVKWTDLSLNLDRLIVNFRDIRIKLLIRATSSVESGQMAQISLCTDDKACAREVPALQGIIKPNQPWQACELREAVICWSWLKSCTVSTWELSGSVAMAFSSLMSTPLPTPTENTWNVAKSE